MKPKTLTLLLIIWSLLLAALLSRNSGLAWLALSFIIYLGTGLIQAPTPDSVRLKAARTLKKTAIPGDSQGAQQIEVQVTVSNPGAPIPNLYLEDTISAEARLSAGKPGLRAALPAGAEAVLSYSIRDRRGSYGWETIQAVVCDPFDLFGLEVALPARASLQVQPEYAQYRRLPLRPRGTLHSPGSIPARLGGNGVDFWGVREYQPGDSLRWLDWRLTARHPQRLFTKEFEQEEIADIGLILDARQKTDVQRLGGGDSLFEHSVSAAASIAEAFLHEGHRMSLLSVNGSTKVVFPGYGKVQLNRMLRFLAQIKPGANSQADSMEFLPVQMFSSHALLVVISPLTQSDWPLFPRLRACNFQVLLVSPTPFDFVSQMFGQDRVSRLALRAALVERQLLLRDIAALQIPVIDWHVDQPLYPLIRHALNTTFVRT
jgi:uncharacterized protein (DUF58 family)